VVSIAESDSVSSPNGWTQTVTVEQINNTPNGSRRVLQSSTYNYKLGAANETDDEKKKRHDVQRNAKRRAIESFDPEKVEAKRQKRRKPLPAGAEAAAAAAAAQPPVPVPVPAAAFAPLPIANELEAAPGPLDAVTQRDWALLRAWLVCATPEEVLEALCTQGHMDGEEEPSAPSMERTAWASGMILVQMRACCVSVGRGRKQHEKRSIAGECVCMRRVRCGSV
jgi:hypothetical protein